jgi:hypothetical protein
MTKVKLPKPTQKTKPRPGKQYPGVHGKVVDWAEHTFEEGNLYLRVRFKDQTGLCWPLQTAHVIVEGTWAIVEPTVESSKWFFRREKWDEKTRRQKAAITVPRDGKSFQFRPSASS